MEENDVFNLIDGARLIAIGLFDADLSKHNLF